MNKITIIGNLTNNAELRTTSKGTSVCGFTVAVNRRYRAEGQPDADFFRVTAWGKLGETCAALEKGRKVAVTGSVSVSTYTKNGETRATLDVSADDVEFLSPRKTDATAEEPAAKGYSEVTDEDLPF